MRIKPPKIDNRSFGDIEDAIHGLVPHYTREWEASDEKDPGVALIKIFSHITENIIHRLNRVPQKNFVAFLDMLGIKRLQAQSARVPVTFILAKGSDTEILIPERTRVSAEKTDEHDELPFETEANLMATPGKLVTVFGIDPFKDAIYAPQKKFLDIKLENRNTIVYKIVSLASKGSRNFQLDHVTGLEKGDILKISDNEGIEYVTVSEITANIVKIEIEEHIKFDHPENTKVEKIMDFNLFEGKNWQGHILYIGDKDIFNIKGTAKFNIFITHRAGTEKVVTRIENVSWQYWGEVKEENAAQGKKENGDDWHDFNVVDGTYGFTNNGEIQLSKLKNGEIKEKEIKLIEGDENGKNSIKCRWIRCKLGDSLGIDAIRILPVLDNIRLTAESLGEKLLPDLAFNNDKPLELENFLPFGKEPRIYDNFAIGSKEIFSKKGADIEIKLTLLDPEGLLGKLSANLSDDGTKILAFARGSYGGLLEADIDPSGEIETVWKDHSYPYFVKIEPGSTPCSAVNTRSSNVSIFVKNVNGHIYERYFDAGQWYWRHIGTPPGVPIKFDMAAVYNETSGISVFVTGIDGRIYEYNRSDDNAVWKWISHSKPENAKIDSSIFAQNYEARVKIFAKDSDGNLYELDCEPGKANGEWVNHKAPKSAKVDSRPFGVVYKSKSDDKYYAKIFVKGSDGKLYKFISEKKKWKDLKKPPGELKIVSDPHGYLLYADYLDDESEGKHIFVRCDDNQLWELLYDYGPGNNTNKKNIWKSHGNPQDSQLYFSPVVIYQPIANNVCVISASNQNSIIEKKKFNGEWKEWDTYRDPVDRSINPVLSWEYWNRTGWVLLKKTDETSNFLKDGSIKFKLPDNIEETEVSGQKNYWIRVRIVSGSYGNETFILEREKLVSDKSSIRPPKIKRLSIKYHLDIETDPQYCITYNNLEYINQTEASRIKDKFFKPFVQLDDKNLSIYLGFDRILKSGPFRIFFAAKELNFTEANKPKMEWAYSLENGWGELKGSSDDTEGLIKTDMLEFAGPADLSKKPGFGKYLSWLKGSLIKGKYEESSPLLAGIYPNTTWAYNEETIKDEFLGSSSGLPDQVFSLLRLPVLEKEEIRVREILSETEKQDIDESQTNEESKPIFEIKDEIGNVTENWVLWKNVQDLFDSTEKDRHYILDRVTGKIRFGNGKNGMIPQAGDNNIKAFSYQTGGGVQGNIKAREIKSIKSSVPGIDTVFNPASADGGADAATLEQVLEFGPAMISNRNRAVTAEDFEWLAKKASRKVAKVKCLPNRNNLINQDKEHLSETGWITVVIVPDEKSLKPMPSLELRRKVQKYLEEHCLNILNSMQHIWVDGPVYIEISVYADIYVKSINSIALVEREAGERLEEFFHPIKGGPESKGWDFGQDVNISDIYAILGNISGVDHAEKLRLDYSEPAGKDYLFYWDDLPGSDNERVIDYLVKNFDLYWVKTASIRNSDDLDISRFGWEKFFNKDNEKLIEFLTQNFNAEWVRSASISKDKEQEKIIIIDEKNCLTLRLIKDRTTLRVIINDNIIEDFIIEKENGGLNIKVRTIKISEGENALFMRLNKDETAVNLIINGGRINEFFVRNDSGRLKIYNNDVVEIRPNFLVAGGKHVINVQFRKED